MGEMNEMRAISSGSNSKSTRTTTPEKGLAASRRTAQALLVALVLLAWTGIAAAEQAWVRGDIRLNVRTGPGTQYRIVTGIGTGDGLSVLKRGEGWTQIRLSDGKQGWIPEGYLDAEPPAALRLERLEQESIRLRSELDKTSSDRETLRGSNDSLVATDQEQREAIERLTLENIKLRAGARYPEMIAGASILAIGMLVGAMLHRSSGRRSSPRIRL
jgi:hypothetical protein